jgi:predicted Rossmann-fold nucleotide-binding protein
MKTKNLLLAACLGALLTIAGCATRPTLESCFPRPPASLKLPFCPYRTNLYTVHELLGQDETSFDTNPAAAVYHSNFDSQCFQYYSNQQTNLGLLPDQKEIAARYMRLHDLAMDEALDKYLQGKKVVGIMGSHKTPRKVTEVTTNTDESGQIVCTTNDSTYMQIALLSRKLAKNGFTIVTGGGPGAMEAANLGAWMAGGTETDLSNVVLALSDVRSSTNNSLWLLQAFTAMTNYTNGTLHSNSVGVPTWFYGQEPPNPFATHIAKFFENSVREEHLLSSANCGIIFARGGPGTVQEVFQAACQSSYNTYRTNHISLVLMDTNFWNPGTNSVLTSNSIPAWPALRAIAGTNVDYPVMVTNDIDAIVEFIKTNSSK